MEVKIVEEIFIGYGFEVVSMCNPVFQARVLAHEKVDFNILLGLCVGHDSLFLQFKIILSKDQAS